MTADAAVLRVVINADSSAAERTIQSFSGKLTSTAKSMAVAGGVLTAGLTLPLVAAAKSVFDVGVSFESAFAGVTKTVSGTAAEMLTLRNSIRDMATEMPASVEQISAVAEAAGALGIAKENILGFTRTMIDLGETTNMTADQAASSLAQFSNITGMAQTDFDRLGSAIVDLGNNGASTEAEIVAMAQRVAGAGTQIGLTVPEILGWSSAMASLGINAEAGGTAISRVMVDVSKAVASGGDDLLKFAEVAGVTGAEFSEMFTADPSGAMIQLVAGLNAIDLAGGNVFQTLEDLGFADVRVQDTMLRLMRGSDLLTQSVNTSNKAWTKNTALAEEAAKRYKTTASLLTVMKNKVRDVGITLYDALAPAIDGVITGLTSFATGLGDFVTGLAETNPMVLYVAAGFVALVAAIGPVLLIVGAVIGAMAPLLPLFAAIGAALASPLLVPIALVVAAIAGLAVAFATNFGGIRDAVQPAVDALSAAWTAAQNLFNYFATVATTDEPLNAWLLLLPTGIQSFVFNLGTAWTVARDFFSYLAGVATTGEPLNLWLLLLPASIQSFALALGTGLLATVAFGVGVAAALTGALTAVQTFATGISTAFSETTFPTLADLWTDFQAGDFETIATKVKETAYTLMLNLDTELNITGKADGLKAKLLSVVTGLSTAVDNLDFTSAITGLEKLRGNVETALTNAFNGLSTGGISSSLGKIRSTIETALITAFNGINASSVKASLSTVKTNLQDALTTAFNSLNVGPAQATLVSRLSSVSASVSSALTGLAAAAKTFDLGAAITTVKTSMNSVRDNILTGLTNAVNGIDVATAGTTFVGLVNNLRVAVQGMDFSGIDWVGVLTGKIFGPIKLAFDAIVWVMDSKNFENLKDAVKGAIGLIPWEGLGTAFTGLGSAILAQLKLIGLDMINDASAVFTGLTGIKVPELKLPDLKFPQVKIQPQSDPLTAPYPSMTVAPQVGTLTAIYPTVQMGPQPKPVALAYPTIKVEEPAGGFNWEGVGAIPAKFVTALTGAFNAENWTATGTTIGGLINGLLQAGVDNFAFVMNIGTPLQDFNTAWNNLQLEIGKEMRAGFNLSEFSGAIATLGKSYVASLNGFIEGFKTALTTGIDSVGTSIVTPIATMFSDWNTEFSTSLTNLGADIRKKIADVFLSLLGMGSGGDSPDLQSGGSIGQGAQGGRTSMSKGLASYRPTESATQATQAPLDWSLYVKPLVWTAIVQPLNWQQFVRPLEWMQIIKPMIWPMFVQPLQWAAFVQQLQWRAFVDPVQWPMFITPVQWAQFVRPVDWNSFIPRMSWNTYVNSINWGNFISAVIWDRYIGSVDLSDYVSGGPAPLANGTISASGGMTLVGERGPELVDMAKGSRVYNNRDTKELLSGGGITINVTANVANDMDVEEMALRIAQVIQRRMQ